MSGEDRQLVPTMLTDVPGALEAADLASILRDLDAVLARCRLLEGETTVDAVVRHALLESIAIAYGRCFKDGAPAWKAGRQAVRQIRDEDLDSAGLTVPQRSTHQELLQLRDHHVAHRVDRTKNHVQLASLRDPDSGSLVGVVALSATLVGDTGLIPRVQDLVAVLHEHFSEVYRSEIAALEVLVRLRSD